MNAVPILAGCDGHIGNGEVFIQFIKGCRASTSSGTYQTCSHFHGLVKMCAAKQSVQACDQRGICRRIIHRRCHNQSVCCLKFRCKLIYHIIKHTSALLRTCSAGDTPANTLIPDLNDLHLRTFLFKYFFHLAKCNGCITIHPGTSVNC